MNSSVSPVFPQCSSVSKRHILARTIGRKHTREEPGAFWLKFFLSSLRKTELCVCVRVYYNMIECLSSNAISVGSLKLQSHTETHKAFHLPFLNLNSKMKEIAGLLE